MSVEHQALEYPVYDAAHLPPPDAPYADGAVFLVDKPLGWSSFRVVGLIRKLIGVKKVGHAGTLDPMATGLLIVCCGKATKIIDRFQNGTKSYEAVITLGAATPSYDKETEIIKTAPIDHISRELVSHTLEKHFTGTIEQIPPMYSAIKHKGTPLYKMARVGKSIELKPRQVTIYNAEVLDYNQPDVTITIKCSKGTYIRSLAYDLGIQLNTFGYLRKLIRTGIGDYSLENALDVDTMIRIFADEDQYQDIVNR